MNGSTTVSNHEFNSSAVKLLTRLSQLYKVALK